MLQELPMQVVFSKTCDEYAFIYKNFSLNQGRLGDLNIYGEWDNENRGIRLDASIKDISTTPSRVTGIIHPLKPESGLDLNIEANELNLKFLEHYMKSIANDIKGRATGKVHFYGKFKVESR